MNKDFFPELKDGIMQERKILQELRSLFNELEDAKMEEKEMITLHIKRLEDSLKKEHENISNIVDKISLRRPLNEKKEDNFSSKKKEKKTRKIPKLFHKKVSMEISLPAIEKETLKRLQKRNKKKSKEEIRKPSPYIKLANKFFSETSRKLLPQKQFSLMENDLLKTNLEFTPASYISLMLFATSIALIVSFFLFLFFLFFDFGSALPIITRATGSIGSRFLGVFWILIVVPLGTFFFMYFYPTLEKRSLEYQIDQELPFATINMSAISESKIEPSKIFSIIISTNEYPHIGKEFTKLINEINIYGHDLVTAMRNISLITPSKKLAELLISLATTINSGGDLPIFFDKRAQTLLFDYRLEREKYTKTAETFMDIYISVVIAAPMILMLILMMMRISGLGLSLSGNTITLIMILGVSLVNIIFLTFLNLKQPKT